MGLKTNGDTTTVNVSNGIMPAECLTVQLQHLHYLHQHQHHQLVTHHLHHKIQVQQQQQPRLTHAASVNVGSESYDVRQNLHKIIVRMFSKPEDSDGDATISRQDIIFD